MIAFVDSLDILSLDSLALLVWDDVFSVGSTCHHCCRLLAAWANYAVKASGCSILSQALPLQRLSLAHRFETAPRAALCDGYALLVLKGSVFLISHFDCLGDPSMEHAFVRKIPASSPMDAVAFLHSRKPRQRLVPMTVSSSHLLSLHDTTSKLDFWHSKISTREPVKMVAAGRNHVLLVLCDGRVLSFGDASPGALGHGDAQGRCVPTEIQALKSAAVTYAAAGYHHSLFVTKEGGALACGDGAHGQLGLGSNIDSLFPTHVTKLPDGQVMKCAAGVHTSCFLLGDGSTWTCGSGRFGVLGHGHTKDLLAPERIKVLCPKHSGFVDCSLGPKHGLLLAYDCITSWSGSSGSSLIRASVFGLGSNEDGQLGHLDEEVSRPKELDLPFGLIPVAIAVSANSSLIVAKGGDFLLIAQGVTQRCCVNREETHIDILYPRSLS